MNKIWIFLLLFFFASSSLRNEDHSGYLLPMGNKRSPYYSKFETSIIGRYGDLRTSQVSGHRHAGIDIKGNFNEAVYSIGNGKVIDIFRDFPNKTVYIKHRDKKGRSFYSAYIHLEDIQVSIGELVTEETRLGRIFNQEELQLSEFGTMPHLHFELRHNISDNGAATFKSMSIEELKMYAIDPMIFFKKNLKRSQE